MEEKKSDDWLKNLPLQSEAFGFQPDEMLACAKCRRMNPPTRLKCFYCAAELEISEAQSRFLRPNLRKLEPWEKGFNVIVKASPVNFEADKIVETARILKIEKEMLEKILKTNDALPVARAESEKEAEIAQNYLKKIGIESTVLSDEKLNAEKHPRRLRGVEFFADKLILKLFNQDEIVEIAQEDLSLIVTGAIFERRIEATEKRGKKGESVILDSSETASDDSLIDVYSRADEIGYRVSARGFDFSCLAAEKGILAKGNIIRFAAKLRGFAARAEYVDDYAPVRELLAGVWEVEQKNDSKGLQRTGIGKFNVGNVTTVSNLSQFTKYSRLRRNLL